MAVAKFATNNLVKEHDEYVKFMENREKELRESNSTSPILFYKRRLLNGAPTCQNNSLYRAINKWHCIMLSYKIWCELVSKYVIVTTHTPYKSIVNVPYNVLKVFKTQTEKAIKAADCDINKKGSHVNGKYNACRYLAMYWTYLDIIKDTKTQRFIPNKDTIKRAAELFGYKSDENPFKMNGVYWNWNKEEEPKMEEKTEVNDDILKTPIRDLNLTIRSFNCLYRSGIKTLGDICMKSQRQLLKVRNLGRNSLNEIKAKLAEYDYYYMDLDSNAQKAHPEEESVVDICEQVVDEMEEEPKKDAPIDYDFHSTYQALADMREEHAKLLVAYDDAYKRLSELSTRYDLLLKEKLDLENYNSRLKDDVCNLRDECNGLKARRNALDPDKMDVIKLLNYVICKMESDKMDWLFLTINGMTIDIHKKADVEGSPRMSYTIRTREE